MLLTIVTVNKNSGYLFSKTANSIITYMNQDSRVKWLIIDSLSNDISGELISKLRFESKNDKIEIIRELDDGIYNAMNKGISLANTKYILFINSGDTINSFELCNAIEFNKEEVSIICGYTTEKTSFIFKVIKKICFSFENVFRLCLPSSHNSIIYYRRAIERSKFNESFKFGADYDQYLTLLKKRHKFSYKTNFKISNISRLGYISQNKESSYIDYININKKKFRILGYYYWYIRLFILKLKTIIVFK